MFNPYVGVPTYVGYGAYAAADLYSNPYAAAGYYDADTSYEYSAEGGYEGGYEGGADPMGMGPADPSMHVYNNGYGGGHEEERKAGAWSHGGGYNSTHAQQQHGYGMYGAAQVAAAPPAALQAVNRPRALQIVDPSTVPVTPAATKPAAAASIAAASAVRMATAAPSTSAAPAAASTATGGPIMSGRAREEQLMSVGSITALSALAPHWVVVLNFSGGGAGGAGPAQRVVTATELVELRRQRKLQVQTLLVGIRADGSAVTAAQLQQLLPLPASFFRPLLLLAAMNARGSPYMPVTVSQVQAGEPPAGWCLPAFVFAAQQDHQGHSTSIGTGASATSSTSSGVEGDATSRLFAACAYIAPVLVYSENGMWRSSEPIQGSTAGNWLSDGRLTLFHPVVGLRIKLNRGIWLPTGLCLPLGMLVHAVQHGFTYHPMSQSDVEKANQDPLSCVPPVQAVLAPQARPFQPSTPAQAAAAASKALSQVTQSTSGSNARNGTTSVSAGSASTSGSKLGSQHMSSGLAPPGISQLKSSVKSEPPSSTPAVTSSSCAANAAAATQPVHGTTQPASVRSMLEAASAIKAAPVAAGAAVKPAAAPKAVPLPQPVAMAPPKPSGPAYADIAKAAVAARASTPAATATTGGGSKTAGAAGTKGAEQAPTVAGAAGKAEASSKAATAAGGNKGETGTASQAARASTVASATAMTAKKEQQQKQSEGAAADEHIQIDAAAAQQQVVQSAAVQRQAQESQMAALSESLQKAALHNANVAAAAAANPLEPQAPLAAVSGPMALQRGVPMQGSGASGADGPPAAGQIFYIPIPVPIPMQTMQQQPQQPQQPPQQQQAPAAPVAAVPLVMQAMRPQLNIPQQLPSPIQTASVMPGVSIPQPHTAFGPSPPPTIHYQPIQTLQPAASSSYKPLLLTQAPSQPAAVVPHYQPLGLPQPRQQLLLSSGPAEHPSIPVPAPVPDPLQSPGGAPAPAGASSVFQMLVPLTSASQKFETPVFRAFQGPKNELTGKVSWWLCEDTDMGPPGISGSPKQLIPVSGPFSSEQMVLAALTDQLPGYSGSAAGAWVAATHAVGLDAWPLATPSATSTGAGSKVSKGKGKAPQQGAQGRAEELRQLPRAVLHPLSQLMEDAGRGVVATVLTASRIKQACA